MKQKGGLRAQQIAIFAAGMLVLVVAFFTPGGGAGESAPPSTFQSGAGGAKALYLTLAELGLDVERWIRPTADLSADAVFVLVVLAPSTPFGQAEAKSLADWVEGGGRLVYAAEERGDPVLDALGLRLRFGDDSALERAPELSPAASDLVDASPESLDPRGRVLDATGFEKRTARASGGSCEPLYVDARGHAGIALVRRGAGSALVIAGTEGLTNDSLAKSEVALVVLRELASAVRDAGDVARVAFEEYHHGHRAGQGVVAAGLAWLAGTRAGWALLALCAVGFTALVTGGLRQGGALPPPPRTRRSSLEHVVALADAYERARARARPARELVLGLRMALGGGDLESTLAHLRAAEPDIAADLDLVLAATSGPTDLVELAAAIDRVRAVADRSRRATLIRTDQGART